MGRLADWFVENFLIESEAPAEPVTDQLAAAELKRQRPKIFQHIARYERAIACTDDPTLLERYRRELAVWQQAAEESR